MTRAQDTAQKGDTVGTDDLDNLIAKVDPAYREGVCKGEQRMKALKWLFASVFFLLFGLYTLGRLTADPATDTDTCAAVIRQYNDSSYPAYTKDAAWRNKALSCSGLK